MERMFGSFATKVSQWSGKPITFSLAFLLIIIWGITGPLFNFSETWQLVVNTGTTIITFLMVFVLQNSQNRDSRALQMKLDELIISSHAANRYVGIEKLNETELRELGARLEEHAKRLNQKATDLSIDHE